MNDTKFTAAVKAAVKAVPAAGWFGEDRVFISSIWTMGRFSTDHDMDLPEFKARLLELNGKALSLARADMAPMMDAWLVKRSLTTDGISEFHFLIVR